MLDSVGGVLHLAKCADSLLSLSVPRAGLAEIDWW